MIQIIIPNIQRRVSISARKVDSKALESALKLMLIYSYVFRFKYKDGMKRKIGIWHNEAKPFFSMFNIPVTKANAITKKVLNDEKDEQLEAKLDEFFKIVGKQTPEIKKNLTVPSLSVQLIGHIKNVYLKESENAFNQLSRNISYFKDTDLSSMFVPQEEVLSTSDDEKELRELVRKYTKLTWKYPYNMPSSVLKDWRDYEQEKKKKHDDAEIFHRLRKKLDRNFKNWLKSAVRKSGEPLVSSHTLMQQAKDEGVTHFIPEGFVGKLDDVGNYYTTEGIMLEGKISGLVEMNQNYNAKKDDSFVLWMHPATAEKKKTVKTANKTKEGKVKKFKRVEMLSEAKLKALSNKWTTDMVRLLQPRIQTRMRKRAILGTLCEFIFDTGARVGKVGQETNGTATYGATILQVRHITQNTATKMVFKYLPGKSSGAKNKDHFEAALQIHELTASNPRHKMLMQVINVLIENKKPTDTIFTAGGDVVNQKEINNYLRSLGMTGTIKDFRTLAGTSLMRKLLEKSPFKEGVSYKAGEIEKWVKMQAVAVGEKLGHTTGGKVTHTTAIANYINPDLIEQFLQKHNVRASNSLQKVLDSIKGVQ